MGNEVTITSGLAGRFFAGGDVDIATSWIPDFATSAASTDVDVISLTTPDGALRVTFEASTRRWRCYLRGVNVLNTATIASNPTEPTFQNWLAGDQIELRFWYRTTYKQTRGYGLRGCVNGCGGGDTIGTPSGSALQAATSGTIQGRIHADGSLSAGTIDDALSGSTLVNRACDVVILGDSICAPRIDDPAVGTLIATNHALRSGRRIYSQAQGGAKVDGSGGQTEKWQAGPNRGAKRAKAIVIQCGVNNVAQDQTSTQVIAALIALVQDIRAHNPWATIFLCTLTPARGYLSAPRLAEFNALNTAIRAGAIPADEIVDTFTPLADGLGSLLSAYDVGDHLHTNLAGRQQNASTIATALDAYGYRYAANA